LWFESAVDCGIVELTGLPWRLDNVRTALIHSKQSEHAAANSASAVQALHGFHLSDYSVELTADATVMAIAFKR
jgi:hypothetical protein